MEMQLHFFSINAFFLLLLVLFFLVKQLKIQKSSGNAPKLPPGPNKLPFIGNLHQLLGSLPHHSLKKLADKYGPLMHLQLGELSTIIVSSPKLAKEVLQTNSLAFANRPQLVVAKIIQYNNLGVSFCPYGDYWRQMRQIYIMELLSAKSVQSFFSIMEDELSFLVGSIEAEEGRPFTLNAKIVLYLNKTISRATVGRVCKDQGALILAAQEVSSLAGIFNIADLFPSLKILQLVCGLKPKLDELWRKLDVILDDIVNDHEKSMIDKQGGNSGMEEEDVVDVLLKLKEINDFQFPVTKNSIKALIFELSVAGTTTSSVLVEWAMSEMLKNPRIMAKAQSEVRQAFKAKKRICGGDIQGLKYLKWVIKETLRLHPPGPLLAPRECREECTISGYNIPINTVTIVNAWAIGRDPEYWNDPEKFNPERFSDKSIDFRGNNFELIPFGAGKRVCPGITYGVTNVELVLANLLYHFDWKLPQGINPQDLDMTEVFGASAGRKNNLYLDAKIYIPSNDH
ncbi:premnaspirodiene oxygenase-like [Coffea arabica]|uniref:Premnaspirodiene oxygenase-like n=1 Tax=Coffea arabica TaxID=13443 RepID=A0A6P6U2B4_COFAR|nr:premnaspirodiene oxygenase-like [Coffea arabica]